MPDTDFQKIELNLIPKKGDEPVVFYASQYETARPFIAALKWGNTEFAPGDDCWAEIDIRKNDDNIVVITDDVSIDNNEVSVILPVQALTCIGKNLGQVKIYAADDQLIAALNFILEVQADPLAGGVTSETAIDNLTQQIEDITQEVIGEDYYNKTEVDTLLADKADISDLPDMSQYYDKSQTDTLLNAKADKLDTYTKAQVDSALSAKANTADLATVATSGDYDDLINKPTIPAAQIQSDYAQADNTQVDYIKNKPDIDAMIAAALLSVMPVETATGNPCTFDTDIAAELQGLTAEITASGGNGTPSTPIPIVGHSELNLVRCGVNLWDEEWENGTFDTTTGANITSGGALNQIRAKNKIRVVAGTTIRGVFPMNLPAHGLWTIFYDANNNVIPYAQLPQTYRHDGNSILIENDSESHRTLQIPSGCVAIRFYVTNEYPSTYNHDISINYPSTDTSYHEYNGQTFTVSFGQTVYGGVYDVTRGKLHVTHGYVDLSTLSWTQTALTPEITDVYVTGALQGLAKYPATNSTPLVAICSNYSVVSMNAVYNTNASIGMNVGGNIYVRNDGAGVSPTGTLAYELATPIEIDVSELSVDTIVGTNNITSDCNGDVTASYKVSIQKYVDDQ